MMTQLADKDESHKAALEKNEEEAEALREENQKMREELAQLAERAGRWPVTPPEGVPDLTRLEPKSGPEPEPEPDSS